MTYYTGKKTWNWQEGRLLSKVVSAHAQSFMLFYRYSICNCTFCFSKHLSLIVSDILSVSNTKIPEWHYSASIPPRTRWRIVATKVLVIWYYYYYYYYQLIMNYLCYERYYCLRIQMNFLFILIHNFRKTK